MKSKRREVAEKYRYEEEIFGSDEKFYMIIDYTSGGAPIGITWEDAIRDGLVEDTKNKEISDEDLPF